jgi:hypothetical protein
MERPQKKSWAALRAAMMKNKQQQKQKQKGKSAKEQRAKKQSWHNGSHSSSSGSQA